MRRDLRFEAVYPYPPERVWRALTSREELQQWLMENDFEPKLHHKFQFRAQPRPGFDGIVNCELIELEESRRVAYKWVTGKLSTVVRFLLEPAEQGGTRVVVEHNGFEDTGSLIISASITWKRMLRENLPALLTEGELPMPTNVQCNLDIVAGLLARYERGGSAFNELVASIPAELLDVAAAGEWSARETALHVVDAEIVGAARLRMIAAQPGSTLSAYAGDIWARELAYAKQPLEPALQLFQALRRTTINMLRQLPEAMWSNRAEHEEAGEVTLASYLDSHCEHAEIHMQEIEALLRRLRSEAVVSAGQ